MSRLERRITIEKALIDEFNFLKNLERKEGKDKVKWPERVKIIFDQYD